MKRIDSLIDFIKANKCNKNIDIAIYIGIYQIRIDIEKENAILYVDNLETGKDYIFFSPVSKLAFALDNIDEYISIYHNNFINL